MALAVKERQRRYRESKRKAGFRLLQIWVPDTSDPEFAEEARVSRGCWHDKSTPRKASSCASRWKRCWLMSLTMTGATQNREPW